MGQKVHPYGFRLGFNKTWRSRWFSDRDYAKLLHEDLALRADLKKRFSHAGVSRIETERAANKLKIDIYTSRPGIIIGRKGTEVDKLKQEVQKRTNREVFVNIQEIQKPELEAQLISESVAVQLEKRVAFRRAMRKAVESALRFGARGIKGLPRRTPPTERSASRCGSTRASGWCRVWAAMRNTGIAHPGVRRAPSAERHKRSRER